MPELGDLVAVLEKKSFEKHKALHAKSKTNCAFWSRTVAGRYQMLSAHHHGMSSHLLEPRCNLQAHMGSILKRFNQHQQNSPTVTPELPSHSSLIKKQWVTFWLFPGAFVCRIIWIKYLWRALHSHKVIINIKHTGKSVQHGEGTPMLWLCNVR